MILTDRLLINQFDVVADVDDAFRLYGDPEVMRFVAGGPHRSVEQTAAELVEYREQEERSDYSFWAVRLRADGSLIGDCGLFPLEGVGPEVELGFTFAAPWWNQGFATEAGAACTRYGLEDLGLAEICAVALPDNHASQRVLEKIGFDRVGARQAYGQPHIAFRIARPEQA